MDIAICQYLIVRTEATVPVRKARRLMWRRSCEYANNADKVPRERRAMIGVDDSVR